MNSVPRRSGTPVMHAHHGASHGEGVGGAAATPRGGRAARRRKLANCCCSRVPLSLSLSPVAFISSCAHGALLSRAPHHTLLNTTRKPSTRERERDRARARARHTCTRFAPRPRGPTKPRRAESRTAFFIYLRTPFFFRPRSRTPGGGRARDSVIKPPPPKKQLPFAPEAWARQRHPTV